MPNSKNYLGATMYLAEIDRYIQTEMQHGAMLGPFNIPPFLRRMGISPLSTRPKRESAKRHIIMDLSFPKGSSVNDGISKFLYCGKTIQLSYPTIDTLAKRITELGDNVRLWKKDMVQAFRQVPLRPRDYSLIGYRWQKLLFFKKVVPMGLHSAAYICQRVTNAIVYLHRQFGYWSINYLDNFGSVEKAENAWSSYTLMGHIMLTIGVQEAREKAVPPTTRMEFLGNTVDTIKKTIEVSETRKIELLELCEKCKNLRFFTKRQLQSLIGKLSFVTNCVRPGRIFISRLLQVLRECSEQEKHEVTQEIKQDLRWWQNYLPSFNGVSMF